VGWRPAELPGPLGAELGALPAGASRVVAAGSRRLRLARGELFDRGFPRAFFLVEELTEELRASEKAAYEKLIRTLSHEVNNSIAPVRSLLESIGEERDAGSAGGGGDLEAALAIASTRLDHLGSFMRGYAEVVRLPPPELRPCRVAELVDDILVLLRPELARQGIAARWREREDLPPAALDRNQLEQVLVNVLRNAMEAIGGDGAIEISLARRDGRATLAVRDSGPGIPAEALGQLFTPFFSTKRNGRGLGLTLAHEILSQHGFGFALANHPEGGAEFTVELEAGGGGPAPPGDAPGGATPPRSPRSIET
jgi:signal transduction histidine kinase